MVLNSLNFCLSVNVLISSSNLNEILAWSSNIGCRFFPFITLNISCHSLLACRVSAERSAVILIGIPLYIVCWFSFAAFNSSSLYLIFDSLIHMCLGVLLLGFVLYWTLCASWSWLTISFPMLVKFSTVISVNIFSDTFFFSSSSGTPIIRILVHLMLSQKCLILFSILFFLYSLFCSVVVFSTILFSRSFICSSFSVILLLIPSRKF